ncbi:type VI secretion system-associated FHA domain protein TagH [Methylocapsa aurea]|uniref:type VI secretion system-associated FHA domain protein TagH n=1 Tax=Methylocapsa aurea TaxID=663610 RepID=UPI000561B6E3|nr:type VI secretion system-associated FHA domain protein TagH [Methylocapsa aurea]
MTLILTIENEQSLPNGAPVSVKLADKRGIDIGRNPNLDWTLPDPTRFISGKHCEVRYRDDAYWLNDLSTNGTFLNDSARRIQAPHRLRHGDRLAIGPYIIAVAMEADAEPTQADALEALLETSSKTFPEAAPETCPSAAAEPWPEAQAKTHPEPEDPACAGVFAIAPIVAPSTSLRGATEPRENVAPRLDEQGGRRGPGAFGLRTPELIGASPVRSAAPAAVSPDPAVAVGAPLAKMKPSEANILEAQALEAIAQEAKAWKPPEGRAQNVSGPIAVQMDSNREPASRADSEGAAPSPDEFLRHFALGAGIPDHIFARQDGLKVAEELGALTRMAVENLTQLLSARFKAKRFARTSSQTMIQALDNNPLKFAPTPDDALKIMFGPRTSGYLDAKRAFEGAFTDLKTHQVKTFAAMQQAVRMLVEDLDPKAIDESAGLDKGLAGLFGGRKSRLWDLYLARWQAKTLRHEDGLVDAFMLYFAECYDQAKESSAK